MASKQDPVSGVGLLTNDGGRFQPYSPGPSHATQTPGHSHCFSCVLGSLFYTRSPESLQLQPNHFPFLGLSLPEKEMGSPQRGLRSALSLATAFQKSLLCLSRAGGWLWNVCLSSLPTPTGILWGHAIIVPLILSCTYTNPPVLDHQLLLVFQIFVVKGLKPASPFRWILAPVLGSVS